MKVHLIKKRSIEEYVAKRPSAAKAFKNWSGIIKNADWERPEDIKRTFARADILGKGSQRVIFDIGGNAHRMICSYHFGAKRVHLFIKWIGTHAEYDKLCKEGKQYSVDLY